MIVETGQGGADSNSYCSVAAADAYFAARGNAAWEALDAVDDKAPALIRASDFIEQMFRDRWDGSRQTLTQALSWPRYAVRVKDFGTGVTTYGRGNYHGWYDVYYPTNIVPAQVANACAELALRATTAALTIDETALVKSKKVDVIEIVYADYARQQKKYTAVEQMLLPFFSGIGGLSAKVVRS